MVLYLISVEIHWEMRFKGVVLSTTRKIFKFCYLQVFWWLFVFLAKYSAIWVLLSIITFLALDFIYSRYKISLKNYLLFTAGLTLWGLLHETLLIRLHLVDYFGFPFWIIGLWIIFIGYYEFAFDKFLNHMAIGTLLAILAGPFTWYAVSKTGVLLFHNQTHALAFLGLSWAIFFPSSIKIYYLLLAKEDK